jgi:glycosyltransferase involved in cell wall biosynthesis
VTKSVVTLNEAVFSGDRAIPRESLRIAVVTSLHPDFDSRVWKHAKLQAKAGNSVALICPWAVPDGEVREGVKFLPFSPALTHLGRFRTPFRVYRRLIPLLPGLDIIHFHDLDLLPWMTILSLFKNVVYDVHENYPNEMMLKSWVPSAFRRPLAFGVRWGQLACAQIIRNVVLVAKSQELDLFGFRLRKTYVMNYASIEMLDKVARDYSTRPPSVIFTGTQHENNGSLLYIEIASLVHERRNDVIFYAFDRFFGNTGFRRRLLEEIRNRDLDGVYRLLPNVAPHDLIHSLNNAVIAVIPNLRVAQQIHAVPTKMFEYMAAGLPIVASDLPYQGGVIGGNNVGLLARPEEPETFARAILQLLDDRELAAKLGENGRNAFQTRYSWESQEAVLSEYYRSIMLSTSLLNG